MIPYDKKRFIADKRLHCRCCGKYIEIGEKYSLQYYSEDAPTASDPLDWHWTNGEFCSTCSNILDDFRHAHSEKDEYCFSDIEEYIHEKFCESCVDFKEDDMDEEAIYDSYDYCEMCGSTALMECPKISGYYAKRFKKREKRLKGQKLK